MSKLVLRQDDPVTQPSAEPFTLTAPFRLATPDDVPELARLVHSAYRGESSRLGWTTEADLLHGPRINEAQVAAVVADPESVLLVLPDTDGIAACCHLERLDGGLAYFGMFAVRPGAQGGGIGRRVVQEAKSCARNLLGALTLEMTVIAQRVELISWYVRLGFTPTSETRPFPYGKPEFGIPQRLDLYFVVLQTALADSLGDENLALGD
jgi:GNAT superfamily N-acetyltransferase